MKKLLFTLIIISAIFAIGCNKNISEEAEKNKLEEKVEEKTPEVESKTTSVEDMKKILIDLLSRNYQCNCNIFILGALPTENDEFNYSTVDTDDPNTYQFKVVSEQFPDYKSLDDYVRSTYIESYADTLMLDFPFEGKPKYVNRNGELYLDITKCGGKGYYVDLANYELDIHSITENECMFDIVTTVEWPAENPVEEEYIISCKAIFENGKWLLEKLYS